MLWGCTAGGSSMVVHLALLLVLGLLITPQITRPPVQIVESQLEPPREMEDFPTRLPVDAKPAKVLNPSPPDGPNGPVNEDISDAVAAAIRQPKLPNSVSLVTNALSVEVGVMNLLHGSRERMQVDVPEGTRGEPLASVRGIDDAMDRITQEILNRLAHRKLLIVWLFDESESMQDDRADISARVHRVYEELKLSGTAKGDALISSVMSYGAGVTLHTKLPTSDHLKVEAAIAGIPNDPSGKEMMCGAINAALAQHQTIAQQSGRQLISILVTDESGDMTTNHTDLESTIAAARAARCPIYILGREAVFGYPYAHLRWIDPETKISFWLRIDRGPETPDPEQLQVDGIHRRHDAHPSGFGPYEQARLARQTGGVFFLLPSPEANLWRRDDRIYDADAMRPYLPDLSARGDYAVERDKHPMRAALWKVITDLNPYLPPRGALVQVRFWDWPIDPAAFAREAETNIKKAQTLEQYFALAQRELEKVRSQRDRDPSLRWRANFDTTYAQTIAYQARLREYVAYIKAFNVSPKAIKNVLGPARPTNAWDGAYIARTLVNDSETQQMRERATALYRQTLKDHAGTPWAARAEFELARGFGIELREDYEDPRRGAVLVPEQ
ncbi:MAG: hypothetical protein C0483_05430 [Pirellula sp.]|nr:hypothetical protein [Pirellula sp.]